MKKETVIGTIGKTHGVRSIAKPQRIASRISAQIEPPSDLFGDEAITVSEDLAASPGRLMLKSWYSGLQLPSLQAFVYMLPLNEPVSASRTTSWAI